ncbi:MAG: transcriptional repressor LexA [Propionibacteriaceae bacterium]|nr:transcriptional repressor LexA [Propionibacteriaceae bacterium]
MAWKKTTPLKVGRPSNREVRQSVGRLGPPDPDCEQLTLRQRQVLQFIKTWVDEHGYPPTIREIADHAGFASPSSAQHQLRMLETLGFIRRDPNRPRAMEVTLPTSAAPASAPAPAPAGTEPASATAPVPGAEPTSATAPVPGSEPEPALAEIIPLRGPTVQVPLVGRIAAGTPILAEQHVEDTMALPEQLTGRGTLFMLEVHGDSMVDAAICDGDYVVVRAQPTAENGEIVAALLDGEATVKTLKRSGDQVWLVPHNDLYSRIDGREAVILGKVVTVLRRL